MAAWGLPAFGVNFGEGGVLVPGTQGPQSYYPAVPLTANNLPDYARWVRQTTQSCGSEVSAEIDHFFRDSEQTGQRTFSLTLDTFRDSKEAQLFSTCVELKNGANRLRQSVYFGDGTQHGLQSKHTELSLPLFKSFDAGLIHAFALGRGVANRFVVLQIMGAAIALLHLEEAGETLREERLLDLLIAQGLITITKKSGANLYELSPDFENGINFAKMFPSITCGVGAEELSFGVLDWEISSSTDLDSYTPEIFLLHQFYWQQNKGSSALPAVFSQMILMTMYSALETYHPQRIKIDSDIGFGQDEPAEA